MKISPVVTKLSPLLEGTIQSGDADYDRGRHRMPWGAWAANELRHCRNGLVKEDLKQYLSGHVRGLILQP